jgi:nitrite reductase (NADH) small subunit
MGAYESGVQRRIKRRKTLAEFVKVAELSELKPGECKAVEMEDKAIALFNIDGTIFALDNTCLHRGGPLGEGDLAGDVVTCPWHGWQYNVRTGENLQDSSLQVARYEVKVEGNDIKVAV